MKRFHIFLVIFILIGNYINNGAWAQNVNMPDANLATAVREILNLDPNAPITRKAMRELIRLEGITITITDLTGLEHATQLEALQLVGSTPISDITPLQGLTQLKALSFGYSNQIKRHYSTQGINTIRNVTSGCHPN